MNPLEPRWDDPTLAVKSDSPRTAKYRRLQSWYRETILDVPAGVDPWGRQKGNFLPAELTAANPGLNLLTPVIAAYVDARVPEVELIDGALDEDRLRRNMLSSQPLCFNVFGALRQSESCAGVLSSLLGREVARVETVECEWAPPRGEHLRDRTAFDAFITYFTPDGSRYFVAVETKYTDSFSPQEHNYPRYAEVAEACGLFRPGSVRRLVGAATNQLWRMSLLAASLLSKGEYTSGAIAVLALADDPGVDVAVAGLQAELLDADAFLYAWSLEDLVALAWGFDDLRAWAEAFEQRYLDLSPVDEPIPHEPSRAAVDAVVWGLVAALVARLPARLRVVETHPDYMYECVELYDADASSPLTAIRINPEGSVWVYRRGGAAWSWRDFFRDARAVVDVARAARRVAARAGLTGAVTDEPAPNVLSCRFLADFFARASAREAKWRCHSAYRISWTGPGDWGRLDAFPTARALLPAGEAAADAMAERLWVLVDDDGEGTPRLCVDFVAGAVWDDRGGSYELAALHAQGVNAADHIGAGYFS